MNRKLKIIIIASIVLLISAGGALGYYLYTQKKTEAKKNQTSEKTPTPDKVIELKAGSGPTPKTESPIPAGVPAPAPLPGK